MMLLLDTHTFLWFIWGDPKLPARHAQAIMSAENSIIISVITTWEIALKYHANKIQISRDPFTFVRDAQKVNGFGTVGLDDEDISYLAKLPPINYDPFDRMLVCQALHHDLTLVTSDRHLLRYEVPLLPF